MSRADNWMPLYIGDYLADTMHLEAREHGAYLLLIMHYWRNGPLPDDDRALAGIARVDRKTWCGDTGPIVRQFFASEEGKLHHKRIDIECERARGISGERSNAGARGAASRWGKTAQTTRSQRLAEARERGTHTKSEWQAMVEFHERFCARCGAKDVEIVKDHIQPIYQGGSDGIANLQPLCVSCNSGKGADSTDHRKDGWEDAFGTPNKTPGNPHHDTKQNAQQTPGPLPLPVQRKKEPPAALSGCSPPKPSSRGSRLATNWEPGPDERREAIAQGLDPERVADRFRDYWIAVPGQRGIKLDWAATWRNWCRKDGEQRPSSKAKPLSKLGFLDKYDGPIQ